jgi:hypothetical protein
LHLAVLICVLSRAHAQDPLSFFVEIEPARSTFFMGDALTVNVFSNRGQLVNPVQVEILAGDRVVRSDGLFVQMSGREIRRRGAIFFWDHEVPDEPTQLAVGFGAFLDLLEPFDIQKIEPNPGQVKKVWVDPAFLERLKK